MNYFLMMIILLLCGGGYLEYSDLQEKGAAAQQQVSDLSAKADKLQADNKALEDDKARLTKGANDAQAEIADLTKQIQTAQSALAEAKSQIPQAPKATTAAEATAMAAAGNNLGSITALNGKTYQNCQLLKIKPDGIVFNHSEGITEISFGLLPPDLQKRFGYDPHQAAALTEAQIQFQEEQRRAAAGTAATGH